MAKITPVPTVIRSIRNEHNNWPKSLCELIDNALDAGASQVYLDFGEAGSLTVRDDGRGCDNVLRMLRQGDRQDHAGTAAGMYGVGGKCAMIWLSRQTTIRSVSGGVRRSVFVDWDALQDSDDWEIADPLEAAVSEPNGTAIRMNGLLNRLPSSWNDLLASLGTTYAPSLRAGVWIKIRRPPGKARPLSNWESVLAAPQPELTQAVTAQLTVSGRRRADVTMGILTQPHQQTMQGMTLAIRGGRVMRTRTRVGMGDEPTPGLYGYAEIYPRDAWGVNKLKDGISEQHQAELSSAITGHPGFAALAREAAQNGHEAWLDHVNDLLAAVAAQIGSAGRRRRKAVRGPRTQKTGAVIPTGRGSPHTKARVTQPGATFSGEVASGRITVHVQSCGEDGPLFDVNGSAVFVNRNHPFYEMTRENMEILAPMAVMYLVSHRTIGGQKGCLGYGEVLQDSQEEFQRQVTGIMECYASAARRLAGASEVRP